MLTIPGIDSQYFEDLPYAYCLKILSCHKHLLSVRGTKSTCFRIYIYTYTVQIYNDMYNILCNIL